MSRAMNHCPDCGARMEYSIPAGDDRPRYICTATGDIFYQNPRNIVGCVVEYDGRVLMCRRAITPRLGFWTLPAGFMELGETCAHGGMRETLEETGVSVTNPRLFSLLDITHIGQVHMFFIADIHAHRRPAGPETSEVRFMAAADIPWSQLAFPSIHRTLTRYFADRAAGRAGLHVEELTRDAWSEAGLDETPNQPRG